MKTFILYISAILDVIMASLAAAEGTVKPTSCFHGGIYSVNPKLVKVDFSSNINPLGISKKVLASICRNLPSISASYPDPECHELKNQIINYLDNDLSSDCIFVGNGATEIIHDFARAFVRKNAVIPVPTFCEYEVASHRMGASVMLVPLENMRLDPELVIKRAKEHNAVFLCNPNNPTGLLCTSEIKKVIEELSDSTKILVDESFMEFVEDGNKSYSLIDKVNEFDNLVVLRSFTKSFALAGLRVGYCVCSPKLAKQISANSISWNVNGVAQLAAVVGLNDTIHVAKARAIIKKERNFMHSYINKNMQNYVACKSDVNYFLIHVKNKDSTKLRDLMLMRTGILIRDCSTFSGMGHEYARVAVKTHKENLLLLDALRLFDTQI
jgi:threonine-phosphate decarboxylase